MAAITLVGHEGMSERVERRRSVWICLGLAAAVVALYWPVQEFEFTNLDDPAYVMDNPQVLAGLTGKGLVWALVTREAEFWHPLTWLSHMLDCQLYGLKAGGHHVTNVVLHLFNTLLLFGVLRRMTKALWRSGLVAALFGLHPLHVETVAWVADRKDVLSTLFWLLTLWAYSRYVAKCEVRSAKCEVGTPASGPRSLITDHWSLYYVLALCFFALGLMSKPMLVTLPFVLLLLDYWPLRRFDLSSFKDQRATLVRLVREKVPFFGLTVAGSVVAFMAQKGGGGLLTLTQLSLGGRVANALISYVRYLGKTVWPADLAVYYPHPGCWPWWQVAGALLLLAGVTVVALRAVGRRPYLAVGWLWYVGTLVPVIGLVQIGSHALADRYSYVPLIGIFMMGVWGTAELLVKGWWGRRALVLVSAAVLAGCLGCSWIQVRYWRNSIVLFEHTLAVTENNALAHNNLGAALFQAGRVGEAIAHYEEALRLKPDFPEAHNNMGVALFQQNRVPEAIVHLEQVLQLEPDDASAHYNLGKGLLQLGRAPEAAKHLEQVLRVKPEDVEAHNNLAVALFQQGRSSEAIEHLNLALRFEPEYFEAQNNLGKALLQLGRVAEAVEQYEQALRLKPESGEARNNLGRARYQLGAGLAAQGKWDEAIAQYQRVVQLKPDNPQVYDSLGLALSRQGRFAEAAGHFGKALEIEPGLMTAQNNLAWLLGTCGEASVRDGARAVGLAEKANQIAGGKDAGILDTLAAAYAEAGRFDEAVRTATAAIELAQGAGQAEAVRRMGERLLLYQAKRPYHERSAPGP